MKSKRVLPIGDAFVAWSATARPLVADEQAELGPGLAWWRVPWLVLIWLPALVLWGVLRWRKASGDGDAGQ